MPSKGKQKAELVDDGGVSDSSLSEPTQYFIPQENDEEVLYSVIEITSERNNMYKVRWAGNDPKTGKPWAQSWVAKTDCTDDLVLKWKKKKKEREKRKRMFIRYYARSFGHISIYRSEEIRSCIDCVSCANIDRFHCKRSAVQFYVDEYSDSKARPVFGISWAVQSHQKFGREYEDKFCIYFKVKQSLQACGSEA